jgi:hypothetical protein
MKIIDVSRSVMEKIVGYERQRVTLWFRTFVAIVGTLILASLVVLLFVIRDLLEKRAFDFIELFFQDREIIAEFWLEVLVTFWGELSTELITLAVCILGALLIFVIITKRRRAIMQKKLHQLEKLT